MKTRPLKNYEGSIGCEVYDIDLETATGEEILELGRVAADQCIVFINGAASRERLYEIQTCWGDPSLALIHKYIANMKTPGKHWRDIFLTLGYVNRVIRDQKTASGINMADGMSQISYVRDKKNKPTGYFTSGELKWHSDQCGYDDAPRMIGLSSYAHTENSQTEFLCTHDAYMKMSSDMQSMVKELKVKHKFNLEGIASGLEVDQHEPIRYNMVPVDGMITNLYAETASGRPGIKFPSYTFDGFEGLSMEESQKIYDELKKLIYQDGYIYTQNWQDGQTVYMDQTITLHRRPTNITEGNKRTMTRIATYMNKLYPEVRNNPIEYVYWNGEKLSHDEFSQIVDADRLRRYQAGLEK